VNRDLFTDACLTFLSLPYKWGGDDPIKGFDCSGLIQELYAMIGLDPKGDQTAQGLYEFFKTRAKDNQRALGSLVFYGKSSLAITHIGMMLDDQTIIEAGGGTQHCNNLEDAARLNAFVRLRPYNHRTDIVAIVTPQGLPW
jgi:cell wall-associated NlpC family hydrolase